MKNLSIAGWLFFFGGLLLKFLHTPGASLFFIAGTFAVFVAGLFFFFRDIQANKTNAYLSAGAAFWAVFLLFRLQFWSMGPALLGISPLLAFCIAWSIITLMLKINSGKTWDLLTIAFLVAFVTGLSLSFIRTYDIHYFFHFHGGKDQEAMQYDFGGWDKYSWFLYTAGKTEEALAANSNAQAALERLNATNPNPLVDQYAELLKKHRQQIIAHSWVNFP